MQEFGGHAQALHPQLLQLTGVAGGDAPASLHDHLVTHADIKVQGLAAQTLGYQVQFDLVGGELEMIRLEEAVQNALGVITQGPQQDGCRQLAAPVDTDEDVVLRVELEVQPGATVGNDPSGKEQLARGMGLALIMVEEDARRTVELGDDDPLGAIDDKGSRLGHERHFAHVDFLFLDILDDLGTGRGFAIINDQAQQDAQGGGIGRAAQVALAHIEGWLAETVTDVLQHRVPGVALDRENGLEGGMQPHILALSGFQTLLQKSPIRVDLGREQEGNIQNAGALAEVLADTFFFGERIGHAALPSTCC